MRPSEDIQQSLRDFLARSFLAMRPDIVLDGATPLLRDGIVDSMGVLELLAFIEDTFAVQVEDHEVVEANLGSLDALVRFISAKSPGDARVGVR